LWQKRLIKLANLILNYFVKQELFGIIEQVHRECGHGAARKMHTKMNELYANVTLQQIEAYVELCAIVALKLRIYCSIDAQIVANRSI
jgi:hypothetical protein